MRIIRRKGTFVKSGSMAMLMIISIVVVMTMISLCTYLAVVSKDQLSKNDLAVDYSSIDASSLAIIDIMDDKIKEDIVVKYPWMNNPPDPALPIPNPYNPTDLVDTYKDSWKKLVEKSVVETLTSVNVKYEADTKVRLSDGTVGDYGCIVITVEYEKEIHNYAFFAEENNRDSYEKGDFVLTWIS